MEKEFKTLDEQIAILRNRSLQILDETKAKEFLLQNNYYRVSGYSLTLRDHDVFHKGASFKDIQDIYCFDHELRHLLLKYLEIIEVTVKSIYAYEFTKEYGPKGYLNEAFFTDKTLYKHIIKKSKEQKKRRLPNEAFLKHFENELKTDIPFWAYIDLFTFSDISIFYTISDPVIKKRVSHVMGFTMKDGDLYLGKFLHSMTIIRNLCAHGSRLYNRLFEQKPSLNKNDFSKLRMNKDSLRDNAHLYGFIFVMRRLLNRQDFNEFKTEVLILTEKYPSVKLKNYGFRDDWKDVL